MVSGPLPAIIAPPNAVRFRATFTSRSRTSPNRVETYVRSEGASLAFTAPHPEQVLLDGNHRSTTICSTAVPRRLVLQLPANLPKRSIRDMPGQAVVTDHPGNEQGLNNDSPVVPGQAGGELVDAVLALVSDPARSLAQCRGRWPTVRRTVMLLGRGVVRACPAGCCGSQPPDLTQRYCSGAGGWR